MATPVLLLELTSRKIHRQYYLGVRCWGSGNHGEEGYTIHTNPGQRSLQQVGESACFATLTLTPPTSHLPNDTACGKIYIPWVSYTVLTVTLAATVLMLLASGRPASSA